MVLSDFCLVNCRVIEKVLNASCSKWPADSPSPSCYPEVPQHLSHSPSPLEMCPSLIVVLHACCVKDFLTQPSPWNLLCCHDQWPVGLMLISPQTSKLDLVYNLMVLNLGWNAHALWGAFLSVSRHFYCYFWPIYFIFCYVELHL